MWHFSYPVTVMKHPAVFHCYYHSLSQYRQLYNQIDWGIVTQKVTFLLFIWWVYRITDIWSGGKTSLCLLCVRLDHDSPVNVSTNLQRSLALWFCVTDMWCGYDSWIISKCFRVYSFFNYREMGHMKHSVFYYRALQRRCLQLYGWWWADGTQGTAYGSTEGQDIETYPSL